MSASDRNQEWLAHAERRNARLSVLLELSVPALELANPKRSIDEFLQHVAERMGGSIVLLTTELRGFQRLVGAAGLSRASREMVVEGSMLPYPELANADLVGWHAVVEDSPAYGRTLLTLYFDEQAQPPEPFRGMLVRLATLLGSALGHRRLYEELTASYETLAETQAELLVRERLAALGELAAIVAHEIRNPIGIMFNSLASLEKQPLQGNATELLGILKEEADRINRIVGDLLDFAKPTVPSLVERPLEPVIRSAVEAARLDKSSVDDAAQAAIELELTDDLPPARIDEQLIRQAVVNLITNAVQATAGTQPVRVRARAQVDAPGKWVVIEVVDRGDGVADEAMERLFEPFFTTRSQGTGLGLPVVRRIATAHGGTVGFSSQRGQGCTFSLRLPAAMSKST